MKKYKSFIFIVAAAFSFASCVKALDSDPIDPSTVTSANVFSTDAAYKEALAKIYAGLAITGQQGPTGNSDLNVNDEGFTSYLRLYWNAQELPTDEAVNSWGDAGLPDFHSHSWSSTNNFTRYLYDRIYYQISLANEYIRQVTPKVSGLSSDMQTQVKYYLAEARFMRALSYYHAIDLYGSVPFVTEEDQVGSFFPPQKDRAYIYDYIESELLAIIDDTQDIHLMDAKANDYGRADKAAAWMLLSRLYLNHKVYLGTESTDAYTNVITYSKKVIDAGYTIHSSYSQLFMADNNETCGDDELIFTINFDGTHTQTWGGMTFIISAAIGGSMDPADYGSSQKWGGNRVTSALINKFATGDGRAMFYTSGQNLEISDIKTFTDGYAVEKFTNMRSDGTGGSNLIYVDTDFPVFRLAEAYLNYAEAYLRGGSGADATTAVGYINELRQRAYGDNSGDIASGDLDLSLIIDERAREFFWETQRRTDLIRFGLFTTTAYLWPWKGGVAAGIATGDYHNLYPIPASDLTANPYLEQNPGY
jgi:starch-binding outer membrane protein, SusD/RagB family